MRRVKVKPLTLETANIDNLSHDGRGVARINGKATFVQGALPTEVVEFQYTKHKKEFDEGILLSVSQASPYRVEPKCPHFQVCGGCSLQHLDAEEQIRLKEEQLFDLISRYGHTEAQHPLPAIVGPHWHYRNKARLSVRFVEKKQSALVGFRERNNPRYIAEITQCPILHAKVDKDIPAFRCLINALEDKHCIAQVEVAAGDEIVGLIFRNLRPLSPADTDLIKSFGKTHQYQIFLQPAGPESIVSIYPPKTSEYLNYHLHAFDLYFEFHPSDFTQINAVLNQSMVSKALALMALKPEDRVLDLFCGLGNFSLPMAKFCSKVFGVEGSETMVRRAQRNAANNALENVQFFAANLEDPKNVANLAVHACNKLLIDPPRSGALEIMKQMDTMMPERIVYVSCNPITLARDIDVLVNQKGYILDSAGVLDMFPQTTHVESIALFVKG